MDERDLKILAQLRKNARATLTDMSRDTGIPVSTIFEKMRATLPKYIGHFTCVLKNDEFGFTSRATVILKVDKEQKAEIGQFLERHKNVNSLFRINNGYDFLADVIFRRMIELEEFIEGVEKRFKIKHKEVYFIIGEVKQEGFLADPEGLSLHEAKPQ